MSRIFMDLTDQRFGKLTALRREGQSDRHYANWVCRCDCGRTVIVDSGRLTQGQAIDCGYCKAKPNSCKYNCGVQCSGGECDSCGWNPAVAKRRKETGSNAF